MVDAIAKAVTTTTRQTRDANGAGASKVTGAIIHAPTGVVGAEAARTLSDVFVKGGPALDATAMVAAYASVHAAEALDNAHGVEDYTTDRGFGAWEGTDGRHGKATARGSDLDALGKKYGEVTIRLYRRTPEVASLDDNDVGIKAALQNVAGVKPAFTALLELGGRDAVDNVRVPAFYAALEDAVKHDTIAVPGADGIPRMMNVLDAITEAIDEAKTLARAGLAKDPPDEDGQMRRSLIQAYVHSKDLTAVMGAMGFAKNVTGVHDLVEPAPARDLVWQADTMICEPWFEKYIDERLRPLVTAWQGELLAWQDKVNAAQKAGKPPASWPAMPEEPKVNVGFLNPHFVAAGFLWGDKRGDATRLMDPHRASDHHDGNSSSAPRHVVLRKIEQSFPQALLPGGMPLEHEGLVWKMSLGAHGEQKVSVALPQAGGAKLAYNALEQRDGAWFMREAVGVDWTEKCTNFLAHHMPREHNGVRHLPRGEWSNLEHAITTDEAMATCEAGKQMCREFARVWQKLELVGLVTPWQKLDTANTFTDVPHCKALLEQAELALRADRQLLKDAGLGNTDAEQDIAVSKYVRGMTALTFQSAYEALQAQNTAGDKTLATTINKANPLLNDAALPKAFREQAHALLRDCRDVREPRDSLVDDVKALCADAAAQTDAGKALAGLAADAVAAVAARMSVMNARLAHKASAWIDAAVEASGHPQGYRPLGELLGDLVVMAALPSFRDVALAINDDSQGGSYTRWIAEHQAGFPTGNDLMPALSAPH